MFLNCSYFVFMRWQLFRVCFCPLEKSSLFCGVSCVLSSVFWCFWSFLSFVLSGPAVILSLESGHKSKFRWGCHGQPWGKIKIYLRIAGTLGDIQVLEWRSYFYHCMMWYVSIQSIMSKKPTFIILAGRGSPRYNTEPGAPHCSLGPWEKKESSLDFFLNLISLSGLWEKNNYHHLE